MAGTKGHEEVRSCSRNVERVKHSGAGRERMPNVVLGLLVALGGAAVAVLIAVIATLIVLLLKGDAMQVFLVGGAALGSCLTLEIALVGLYLAGCRRAS